MPHGCRDRGAIRSPEAYRGMELERDGTFEQPARASVPAEVSAAVSICENDSRPQVALLQFCCSCCVVPGFEPKPRGVCLLKAGHDWQSVEWPSLVRQNSAGVCRHPDQL